MRSIIPIALFPTLANSCAPEAELPRPVVPLVKLIDDPTAKLESGPVGKESVVFSEGFDADLHGWHLITTPTDPAVHTDGVLRADVGSEPGTTFVRLEGLRGLAGRVVPVRADRPHRFEGRLRANGLVPAEAPFHGATFWLAELKENVPLDRLVAGGSFDDSILKRHILSPATGTSPWLDREVSFRTRPGTKAVLLACALGTSEDVAEGSIDFSGLRLIETPDRVFWHTRALEAAAARHGTRFDDWRARRLVRADIRGEQRPAVLLLPGESIVFRKRLHERAPLFEAGLSVWRSVLAPGASPGSRFQVSVDGLRVFEKEISAPPVSIDNRWHEIRIDLEPWADRTVELTLRAVGDAPLVVGAPSLRSARAEPDSPNVILISIDMLRSDHVGAYGYARDTTPNLDRLAREGQFFPDMHGQAPYTLPATVSMFTGQFPAVHGVHRGTQAVSLDRSPMLADLLSQRGYRTTGFAAGGFVSSDFGLDAGFDAFTNVDPLRHEEATFFELLRARNPEVTPELVREHGPQRIRSWLERHREVPFFLFLHTYTVHDYDAPEGWLDCKRLGCTSARTDFRNFLLRSESDEVATESDREHLRHRYDAALRYVDSLLGDLFSHLEALEIEDRTLVVVTSDHGEEMFERGAIQHGKTLYEELTRIPLIMRVPGEPARVIDKPVMTIDVAPTILDALGIPRDSRMQGTDVLSPDLETRPVIGEIDDEFAHKYFLRDGLGYKLIHSPRERAMKFPGEKEWELYATGTDPGEVHDLTSEMGERFEQLRRNLLDIIEALKNRGQALGGAGSAEIDEQTHNELEQLGYF